MPESASHCNAYSCGGDAHEDIIGFKGGFDELGDLFGGGGCAHPFKGLRHPCQSAIGVEKKITGERHIDEGILVDFEVDDNEFSSGNLVFTMHGDDSPSSQHKRTS